MMIYNNFLKTNVLIHRSRFLMGCFVKISVEAQDPIIAESAIEAAFDEIKNLEKKLSRFLPESEISLLNREASQKAIRVSDEVFTLLKQAQKISKLTQGCFDVTSAPLTQLWHDSEKRQQLPTPQEITNTLKVVGWEKLELDESEKMIFFKCDKMQIDLGAIGKGYAVQRAIETMKEANVLKATIDTGSSIYHFGDEAESYALINPEDESQLLTTIELRNQSVSTSAANERYYSFKGRNVGHILDPKTGLAVKGPQKTVSIVSSDAAEGDALATAVYVGGLALVKKIKKEFSNCDFIVASKRCLRKNLTLDFI